jgi:hypothetical protein
LLSKALTIRSSDSLGIPKKHRKLYKLSMKRTLKIAATLKLIHRVLPGGTRSMLIRREYDDIPDLSKQITGPGYEEHMIPAYPVVVPKGMRKRSASALLSRVEKKSARRRASDVVPD